MGLNDFHQVLQVTNHLKIGLEGGQGSHRVETLGRVEDISNVQMLDTHESGQTAMLIMDEWNEQYLMVNTTNSRTSCTLRFVVRILPFLIKLIC